MLPATFGGATHQNESDRKAGVSQKLKKKTEILKQMKNDATLLQTGNNDTSAVVSSFHSSIDEACKCSVHALACLKLKLSLIVRDFISYPSTCTAALLQHIWIG